jgi:hypothetical protein
MCVGCEDASQCPTDRPICEEAARSCRACTADTDCPGGLCLEADGACVADADVVFVSTASFDAGSCTRAAPCGTLGFALTKVGGSRNTIHVLSSTLDIDSNPVISKSVYIDGPPSLTTVTGNAGSPPFATWPGRPS